MYNMGNTTTKSRGGLPGLGSREAVKWLFILSLLASPVASPWFTTEAMAAGSGTEVAQSVITGTVVDQTGQPVIGAYVVQEGTTKGTVTDFDGKFSLAVPAGTVLSFSFIGYESVTMPASNGMTVTMNDDSKQIEEVAVVAYGAQKKVTVTGAISSIKSDDLVRTPVSSVSNVLAGQLSGVTTIQNSGEPGVNETDIFVRGKATFAGSDAVKPLIQVDGVEREMWDIDPNEIESVTVLKDASATAVFGVRGANGVILITTKRGKEGKANINVSTNFTANFPTKMIEMANSLQYAEFYNKARSNDAGEPVQYFSNAVIEQFRKGDDPIRFPSIDWVDYIMKNVTLNTQSNISVSGGNDKVRYFTSVGLYTAGGAFEEFDRPYHMDFRYKRFNYRSNVDIDVTKYTTVSVNVSGLYSRQNRPYTSLGTSGMIKLIHYSTPFSAAGFVDGKLVLNSNSEISNAASVLKLPFIGASAFGYLDGTYAQNDVNKVSMDLVVDQKLDMLLKGLSLKLKGSYNSSFNVNLDATGGSIETYVPKVWDNGDMELLQTSEEIQPNAFSRSYGKARDWYMEGSLNYHNTFADAHTVSALFLYNQSKQYYLSSYSDIPRAYVGVVGRVSYDYKNKYMAEVNFGYNGSENFAKENRFGAFPAGSIGWAASEEPFFDILKPAVSFLKVRASWGLVGNDKVGGSRFMYLDDPVETSSSQDHSNVSAAGPAYFFSNKDTYSNNAVTPGGWETGKNNKEVTWEKAFKQDYGLDINFLDNRLTTTFDYYLEHRRDILAQDNLQPRILGFASYPYSNFGEVDSWGWEASIGWNSTINDDWRVWAKLNMSYNQNEIKVDHQAPQNEDYMYTAGRRIGSRSQMKFWRFYDQDAERLYKEQFGQSLPTQSLAKGALRNGDAVYVDLNGDGIVDTDDYSRDYGYTDDPEYIAGLNMGFAWKRLTVSMQWTGAWNVSRVISDVFRTPFLNQKSDMDDGGLLVYHIDNSYDPEHPSQDAEYPLPSFTYKDQNYAGSTLYEKDSKYLRLKTAEIAYDFDFEWMKTIGLKRFQMSINGYNLLTFSPYLWGDPEARASNAPSYPLQRTYTASLKLNF